MKQFPSRASFRDTSHFILAVASELAAPLLRLAARSVSRGGASAPSEWRRALIVGHGHIGDVLCQTVSLGALASGLDKCQFDYLTTPLAAEVLSGNPAITRILPWNTDARPDAVESEHFDMLRATQYDAIICTNVVRHQEALRLALRLRIPNRVAFVHRGLSGLVTLPVRLEGPSNPAAQSRAMAGAITGVRDESELRPRIYLSADDVALARAEWERLGLTPQETVVTCSVTTRQLIGRIPPEFFARVLRALLHMAPATRIVLTGSRDDAPVLDELARTLGSGVAVSAGRLTIRGLAAFLARGNLHFCMDSGPRHIANAAGTPVVFTRNLAVRAAEAGSYCATEFDAMPHGDYLTPSEIRDVLAGIAPEAVARCILDRLRPPESGVANG